MEFFLLFKFVLFVNFLPRSCQSRLGIEKGDKKQVIVYHPKPHHNPGKLPFFPNIAVYSVRLSEGC